MNLKKKAIGLSLIALGAFGTMKAQTSNDNLLAFNDASKEKTEIKADTHTPVIKTGHAGDAQTISGQKSALVIYISGGTQAKYSAEKYAKMLQIMFKDNKRTPNPTDISVVYGESKRTHTMASVYSNGKTYDKNGGEYQKGDGVYFINDVVADIDDITAHHAIQKGIASVKAPSKTTQQLASNNYQP